jgi:predicted DNA-binding transcriptional regulator YafY
VSSAGGMKCVGVLHIGRQPVNDPLNEPAARLEETKRTARILEIVQLIAGNPRRYRRADLAQRFEISERMIQKDLDIIRNGLKLLLCNDRSGYFFDRLPQLPTTPYSFSEALALLIAARTAQLIPGVNSADLAAAIARLESIFPDTFHSLLRDAIERLPQRAEKAHRQAMLTLLHRALIEQRQIRIVYAVASRGGATGERIIEPYHMMPYGRSWYLIAFDHKQQGILQFKIDRIHEAELLETKYSIPADFDVEVYLGDTWGIMRGAAGKPEQVELLFDPEAGRWVAEETWHKSQQSEVLPDGRVRVTFHVGITPEMVSWLLYYGARVQVLTPDWLRERVAEEHRRAASANTRSLEG